MLQKYDYRRKLPHYQPDNKIFFITFCTEKRAILSERARDIVVETCLRGNEKLFHLYGVIVMPDHVHILLTPVVNDFETVSIARIMQAIKSTSSHEINKLLNRKGRVWQEESFDYALRKEERAEQKLQYMLDNPVRAGLVRQWSEYRWIWLRDKR